MVLTSLGRYLCFSYRIADKHNLYREGEEGKIVYRSGAKENDLICFLEISEQRYMGLQLLKKRARCFCWSEDFQPQFGGKEYIIERQLKPEARKGYY